jgi:hypothetical protein
VLLDELTALRARVAQLEAALSGKPQPAPSKPPGRQPADYVALRAERDELAVKLRQIEAFAPGVAAKAAAWVAQVDRVAGAADEKPKTKPGGRRRRRQVP